jgi:hypothetical protein
MNPTSKLYAKLAEIKEAEESAELDDDDPF